MNFYNNNCWVRSILVTLFLYIGICPEMMAQSIKLGLRLGLNNSEFTNFQTNRHKQNGLGWTIGLPIEIKINEQFSVQPEPAYVLRTFNLQQSAPNPAIDTKTTYANLDVPIWLKVYLGKQSKKLYLIAGPETNWLLNGNIRARVTTGGQVRVYDSPQKIPRSMRFGIGLGGGIGFTGSFIRIPYSIDARYQSGWYRVYDPTNVRYRGATLALNMWFK